MAKKKICFIISSIGEKDSEIRKISDQKLNHVYKPVVEQKGYNAIRADDVSNPVLISKDIVKHLYEDDLVIADVTDLNANVFYELAIRNSFQKPVILFKKPDQKLPFDIQDKRAIVIDMTDPDIWMDSIVELGKHIDEVKSNPARSSESIISEFQTKS